jgi:hypothetical protein
MIHFVVFTQSVLRASHLLHAPSMALSAWCNSIDFPITATEAKIEVSLCIAITSFFQTQQNEIQSKSKYLHLTNI